MTRARTLVLLGAALALGIATRVVHVGWTAWDKSLGDVLYAVAVYLVIALVAPRIGARGRAVGALAICFAIECFQATGIPIELAAQHRWVAWVLGTTFAWHDLACYAIGIGAIACVVRAFGAIGSRG